MQDVKRSQGMEGTDVGGGLPFSLLVMLDWMGRSGYFFLGNSNSLASIDISKAYTVSNFSPLFAFLCA